MTKIYLIFMILSFMVSAQTPFTTSLGTFDGTMNNRPVSPLGDWNGDGKDDIAVHSGCDASNTYNRFGPCKIYYGGSDLSLPPAFEFGWFGHFIPTIDFNLDGYIDILNVESYINSDKPDTIKVYFGGPGFDTISDFQFPAPANYPFTADGVDFSNYGIHEVPDFDRDGNNELLIRSDYTYQSYPADNSGTLYLYKLGNMFSPIPQDTLSGDDSLRLVSRNLSFGDIDGDGYCDINVNAKLVQNSQPIKNLFFKGNSECKFGVPYVWRRGSVPCEVDWTRILPDMTGDGKADIFVLKNMGAGYRAFLSKGDVWPPYPSSSMQFPDASNGGYYIDFATFPGDVNGDGYQDIIIPAVSFGAAKLVLGGPVISVVRNFTGSSGGLGYASSACGDYDGDGIDDFVLVDYPWTFGECHQTWFIIVKGDTSAVNPTSIQDEFLLVGYNIEINPYPNPFNPEVKVEYLLPEAGEVNLSVFSSLGEEIISKNLSFRNKGQNETTLDFSGLNVPSGVYLLRLTLQTIDKGTMVKTTKLAFMK
ncbi:hypothetical protein MASR2M39_06720 [Ignavibacteriales bacterium]